MVASDYDEKSGIHEHLFSCKNDNQIHDTMYYEMNHRKGGLAIIFNHMNYNEEEYSTRHGSNVDCKSLTKCLKHLKFDVEVYIDLKFADIIKTLKAVSEKDLTNSDCLFIAVLTHGTSGKLTAFDREYDTDEIFSPVTGKNCPDLVGKPKVFVIQACQGEDEDMGSCTRNSLVTDTKSGRNLSHTFKIPNLADFLIAYATPPGYLAYRDKEKGSPFIQAWCQVMKDYGEKHELNTLCTFVCNRVALQYGKDYLGEKMQIPWITSTLTHLIQF